MFKLKGDDAPAESVTPLSNPTDVISSDFLSALLWRTDYERTYHEESS